MAALKRQVKRKNSIRVIGPTDIDESVVIDVLTAALSEFKLEFDDVCWVIDNTNGTSYHVGKLCEANDANFIRNAIGQTQYLITMDLAKDLFNKYDKDKRLNFKSPTKFHH